MRKITAILLCVLFAAVSFTACSVQPSPGTADTDTVTDAVTEPEETSDPDYVMDPGTLAKADRYKDQKLTVLLNSDFWAATDFFREEDSENPVDSAIFNRNIAVCERYGITLEYVVEAGVPNILKTAFKSGISDYDIAAFCAFQACPLATENLFLDLTQVENLNLKKHYWDQGLFDGLSIDGKLFYITGDISTLANAGTFLMLFNKKLASDYDLENLYQVVRDGRWTLDYLNSLLKEHGYVDDGNAKVDVYDRYGMGIQREAYLAFYFGAGGRMILKDDTDMPYFALNTEKNVSIIDKIYDITRTDNKTVDAHDHLTEPPYSTGEGFASYKAFVEDRCLFDLTNASSILGMRDMNSDYGVLPTPKYDESQKDYCSYVYHGASLFVIPVMNKRPDLAGFVLEALAEESYKTVTPAYYEQTLKRKAQRDADSMEMLDVVFRNRVWDLGYYARWAGFDDSFIEQIKAGTKTFANYVKRTEKAVKKQIDKYIDAYRQSSV